MARRYFRKLALLTKVETTYGVDAAPTGGANALMATDVTFTPLDGAEEARELLLPYLGHQGIILTGEYQRIEYSVEIAGAGTAGSVPAYGASLRGCGMSQTVTADTDVEYAPVSGSYEAVSHHYNRDGVRHVMLGTRGNWTAGFQTTQSGRIPRFRFSFAGLIGTVSDTALPETTFTQIKPVPVSKANTTFSLHGYAGPTESVSFDFGNQVEPRLLINSDSIEIVDRRSTGSAVMEAGLLADKNWMAIARGHTTGAMALQHGSVAGNIVQFAGTKTQIGPYGEGQSQGIMNNTLPMIFQPDAGNDDLKIIVK